jgi:2,3-bisphosphoglycerate-independent phosphoglycerate mutase
MSNTEQVLEKLYAAYGTDSGILFGIKEKDIVKAIVEFTLNQSSKWDEQPIPEQDELQPETAGALRSWADKHNKAEMMNELFENKLNQLKNDENSKQYTIMLMDILNICLNENLTASEKIDKLKQTYTIIKKQ